MGNFLYKSSSTMAQPGKKKSSKGPASKPGKGGKGGETLGAAVQRQQQRRHLDPEAEALDAIRKTLNKDLQAFILDNVLLSVQFFQNFEREVGTLRTTPLMDSEASRNRKLREQQRHCLTPDRLHQLAARRVQFQPHHGPSKHVVESLHSQRLVVVQDNVELLEGRDSGHHSGVHYSLNMEPASPGYVKLYSSEIPNKRRVSYETIDHKSEDSSDDYSKEPEEDEGIALQGRGQQQDGNDRTTLQQDSDHETEDRVPKIVPPSQIMPEDFIRQLHERVEGRSISSSVSQDGGLETPSEIGTPKYSTQKMFGPRSPETERPPRPKIFLTKTERRLSGIVKTPKYPTALANRYRNDPPRIRLAQSLPNLASDKPTSSTSRLSPANSDSSGYKSSSSTTLSLPNSRGSESDYGYGIITELRTARPIQLRRLGKTPLRSSEIPSECFKMREIPHHGDDSDSSSDSDDDNSTVISARVSIPKGKLFNTLYYLNSTDYMASFADVFIDRLFEPLGFSKETTQNPMMQGATIHCDVIRSGTDSTISKTKMNVIPAISSRSWPNEAFEWLRRPRNAVRHQQTLYQWPTQKMVDKVQRFGYNILPVGYLPTRGRNTEHQLEWQLAFPQAEEYLESCLTHAQLRCYLFTMALYKSFLEPLQDSELGLSPAHIRTLLFWQCEHNYASWPEDRPGETLSRFLGKIYDALKREKLHDYFLPQRNLFESTPLSHLRRVQEKLCRIQENLIMHVLIAVRNLRYVESEEDFYPLLDFKQLYSIITTDDYVTLLNPSLGLTLQATKALEKAKEKEEMESDNSEDEFHPSQDVWAAAKKLDRKQKWNKQVRRQIEAEKAAQKLSRGRRRSTDSINVKWQPRVSPDPMRCKLLLELFIPHFIAMARQSSQHRAYRQSTMYLKHAERLALLLREEPVSDRSTVERFMLNIRVLRNATNNGINPKTPNSPTNESENFVFIKKSIIRMPSAVEMTMKKTETTTQQRDTTPKDMIPTITIAEVYDKKTETDTDNLRSAAASANPSENEDNDDDADEEDSKL